MYRCRFFLLYLILGSQPFISFVDDDGCQQENENMLPGTVFYQEISDAVIHRSVIRIPTGPVTQDQRMGIRQTRNIPNRIRYIFPLMFPHFYLIVPHNFCHRHILPAFHSHIPVSVLPLPEIAVQRLHAFLSVRRKRSAFPWAASGDTISYW